MAKTNLRGPKKPEDEVKRVVIHDGFDDMAYESVEHYERMQELLEEHDDEKKTATKLMQDVFTSFHRSEALIDEEVKSLTRDIMSEFHGMKEYKDFHQTTQLDPVASAIGSMQMSPVLLEKMKEIKEEIEKQREEQREKNKEEGKDENDGVPQGEPSLDELDGNGQSSLRQAMRNAIEDASNENEENQAQMRQWGMEPGEIKNMDPKSRLELSDELKKAGKLKNVSDLVGRFKNVATAALATTPSHGSDEIVDIGIGNDINRMIPSEYAKLLSNPLLFYKDFLEQNLLVYNLKGTEHKGKGPLMVVWDRSSSMAGSREEWAVAIVLTLMNLAQKENRAFLWVAFDSQVHDSEFFAKGEKISLEEKMRVAQMGSSGGTEFWAALKKTMELHAQEPELKPADMIFITDGECGISEKNEELFKAWKKEKEVRVFGVGIADGGYYQENAGFESLEPFCDQIAMVNDLGEMTALRQVVQSVSKKVENQ